ncbi:MAG: DGQHR domain-containing protein [Acutalibacter sp.]|jgi:DNA sulfur modification protein DndB|uniref:DGQHR domain-containing protein n=1 Tax=Acutalibacter sp. TaxID=1918636 RepID=UPI00216F85AD|nr:DGQHR domain-containing protein [Acutalibacter sp.]MCI9224126.1 DGQHR domain-containing protein [Acutalibacter sp.]
MNHIIISEFFMTQLGGIDAYVFPMKVKDLLPIYYVAVRGRDNIEGAVQRVLNKRRIGSIKSFILEGNMFFNSFILNWTDKNYPLTAENGSLKIPRVSSAAQVIDGQHRLEGLKQAVEEKREIGEQAVTVVLVQNLTTSDAARIFLNINTEQKPVPNSLVYDLFGEVRSKDYYIVRAKDLATKLHVDPESPYYQCIKMPGAAQGVGKVDLSTVVNALKQFTTDSGVFAEYHIDDFELQYRIICNYFHVIKHYYEEEGLWLKASNPFMGNSGCYAAIEFLCKDLIPKCAEKKSFEKKTIQNLLPLDEAGLLDRDDLKNKQGKEQRSVVYQYLKSALLKDVPTQDEYKF